MLHAALLLLMLEAAQRGPRFTISLKRSTQILQLTTSCRPITPSLTPIATILQLISTWSRSANTGSGRRYSITSSATSTSGNTSCEDDTAPLDAARTPIVTQQ